MAGMGSANTPSANGPSHQPIEYNKPTVICLPADPDNDDFGIELTGGCHSYLGEVCIYKVYTDSISHRDGRLQRGDVVLSVNGKSMKKCSLDEARIAVANSPHSLQLTILRDPDPLTLFTSIEEPKIFITVELWRTHINEPLGISLMERKDIGVFITWMRPGSPADKSQRIRQGDKIIDVNGVSVKGMGQAQVAAILREAENSVVLVLGRIPALYARIQDWIRVSHHFPTNKKATVKRTSSWSYSDVNSLKPRKLGRKAEDGGGSRRQSRRFSAFNLRLRSNSTQMERLAVHSAPPLNRSGD